MDLKTGIFAILAIFCVIFSASAICAAEDGGYAGSNYDMVGYSGSQYYSSMGDDLSNDDLEPGNGLPLENQTGYMPADNETGNTTNTTNITPAAGGDIQNSTSPVNATAQTGLHSAGNPIVALLVVAAVLGGTFVFRRK